MLNNITSIEQIKELVEKLNKYRDAYYNQSISLVEDSVYDEMFDKLEKLEEETGVILANSPTHSVGYTVQSNLNKVNHDHPMLSLGKTKLVSDVIKFFKNKPIIGMLKMDGLTVSCSYDENGNLIKAETRGNGIVGEDILNNAKMIQNLPLHINNDGAPYTIDGEVIIDYATFNQINSSAKSEEDKFSHPRNAAAGSLRQLNTKITYERNLKFIAWRVISESSNNDFSETLKKAMSLGFDVVPYKIIESNTEEIIIKDIEFLKRWAKKKDYPIDGIVFSYNDIAYGIAQGNTVHHPLHSLAFKFYNDCYETVLRDIEWSTSRTGQVNPVAIFDPIDLDGAITTRATLHNVSIIKELELGIGDTITVCRANEVIPKVEDNLTRSGNYEFPTKCPCCGLKLKTHSLGLAEVLFCENTDCPSKITSKFTHFVSREAMNIDGLSEQTIQKFINKGFLRFYADIYELDNYKDEIQSMEGFGEKSYNNLIQSIEKSKNVQLQNYLVAIGIPMVGKGAAKTIHNYFNGDYNKFIEALDNNFDLTQLNDFGQVICDSINNWHKHPDYLEADLLTKINFIVPEIQEQIQNDFIKDKTFVVTGKFVSKTRKEIEEIITSRGGKLASGVTKKTSYLLTNDTESGSSKNLKAKELNIPIMTEEEFLSKI